MFWRIALTAGLLWFAVFTSLVVLSGDAQSAIGLVMSPFHAAFVGFTLAAVADPPVGRGQIRMALRLMALCGLIGYSVFVSVFTVSNPLILH